MANTATRIAHSGYGQIELNQVAFRRDGRIEAQCKLDTTDFTKAAPAENGMLLRINAAERKVYLPDAATDKVLLHYSTEHMYDERTPGLKNWCLVPGTFLPRLGYLSTGDKYTTNTVSYWKGSEEGGYTDEDKFWAAVKACKTTPLYAAPGLDGSHIVSTSAENAVAQVVKGTTMPDGQKAIQFIAL